MDFVFNGIERATQNLMDQLTDRQYEEEIKYFEKIGDGEILTICPVKMKKSKARFTTMFMNCLLHQRYFNLLLNQTQGKIIFERFMHRLNPIEEKIECAICFSESNEAVELYCNHSFCRQCIKKWFMAQIALHFEHKQCLADDFNFSCPLCRDPVE
jgi:hypothetical protein